MKLVYILIITILFLLSCYLVIEIYSPFKVKEGVEYNSNNLDVKYHEDAETLDQYGLLSGTSYVFDKAGNKIALPPSSGLGTTTTYYKPGNYKYGSNSYVPTYEDSVFLSKTYNR
jgi:hypothetical protein